MKERNGAAPTSLAQTYDRAFYDDLSGSVRASAEVVVPLVVDIVRPASVLDVGCGRGTWLSVFRSSGVPDVLGIDGAHIDGADLEVPGDIFQPHDLQQPFTLGRRFDLAVSLEVGEHLDAAVAPQFVASLVEHAPVVLFSAAIPFQGGAGHVNEQWPSYWAALFAKHDYVAYDVVRPAVWEDDRVAFWYAQNMILYVDRAHAPALRTDVRPEDPPRDLVHPALHIRDHTTPKRAPAPPSLSRLVRDVPGATRRAVRTRLSKLARVVPSQRRVKGLGGARGRRRLQIRKLLAPLVRGSVVLTTADGLKLRITSDPVDEQIAQHLLGPRRPDYFPALSLPDGLCILDIGAHHGLYAAAALHTYRESQIICVEPSASALEALYANLRLNNFNGRARVVRAGLATRSGSGELRHTAEGSWGASLFEDPADAHESETVALQTLDEILAGSRPDILKCNAEGAEYALFDQLAESDLRPAFMLVMVHPEFGDLDRLLAQAEAMGYTHERIGTAGHPAFHMTRSM